MRAAIFNGPRQVDVGDLPDPTIGAPTDAVIRVVLACVRGAESEWGDQVTGEAYLASATDPAR
jgi:threonine dehydrogenase-like Zn-dependent dehydrogenase